MQVKCDLCELRRFPPNMYSVLIRPKTLHRQVNICRWCVASIQEVLSQKVKEKEETK